MKQRPASFYPALASVLALAAVAFLGKSYESGLRGIDSNIHAAVSMSVTSGPTLAPRLPIPVKNFEASNHEPSGARLDPDRVFNDHPFFVFWLNGLVMRLLGPSAWSARLLTGLFSVGSVALTLAIGETLTGSAAFGVTAALLLVSCRDFVLTSATVSLDTALVFFILLGFLLWLKRRWWALGLAAGVGFWVKTPLVGLVFPVALIWELLDASRRERIRRILPLLAAGALAAAVGGLLWVYVGVSGGWDLVRDYWVRQLWGTAVGGRGAQAQGWDWGAFFFYNLRTGFIPGLVFLVAALPRIARREALRKREVAVPLLAVGIVGLAVTGLRFKLGHYFTPIFPFLALLAAQSVAPWLERRADGYYRAIAMLTPALLAVLLVTPVSLGPEAFVALRRFVPFIQTQGSCDDIIALVPGGEPVGSDLDYKLFLNFYTGRTIEVVACERLAERLAGPHRPAWVILSEEHRLACLKQPAGLVTRVGTQDLLNLRQPQAASIVDLTPLELDLQAVRDCQAPRYPHDLWHKYLSAE